MCMLLIWVYTREYIFGVYGVYDCCEVYFDGLEGPYSVADGEGCRRGTKKEYQLDMQIMNHTPSAWYRTSARGVQSLLDCWIRRRMYQPLMGSVKLIRGDRPDGGLWQ
jgi:hypothetical protein